MQIRLLVGRRRDLVADQTRRLSRLHDLVISVYPLLERALDLTTKADLWLLTRYVTPAELRRAGHRRVVAHLHTLRGMRADRAERTAAAALAAATAQRIAVPGEWLAADLARELAGEALTARDRIAALEGQLEERLADHPDAVLIRSLPEMGAIPCAEFLAEAEASTTFPPPTTSPPRQDCRSSAVDGWSWGVCGVKSLVAAVLVWWEGVGA